MAAEIHKSITALDPRVIKMGQRLRPVSAAGVEALIASIEHLGGVMKDPIHVRRQGKDRLTLIAGAHRLTAALELGWESVPVTVWKCSNDFAALMEIDDNIAGAELTALDTAVFLAARKRVYEKMHPQTAHRAFKGNQHTANVVSDIVSFTTSTAEKLGLSKRQVERLVAVGEALEPHQSERLRATPKPVALVDLMNIAKIGEPEEREAVVEALADGRAKNAKHARQLYAADLGTAPAPLTPNDTEMALLKSAWGRARKTVRREFLLGLLPEDLDEDLVEAFLDG